MTASEHCYDPVVDRVGYFGISICSSGLKSASCHASFVDVATCRADVNITCRVTALPQALPRKAGGQTTHLPAIIPHHSQCSIQVLASHVAGTAAGAVHQHRVQQQHSSSNHRSLSTPGVAETGQTIPRTQARGATFLSAGASVPQQSATAPADRPDLPPGEAE